MRASPTVVGLVQYRIASEKDAEAIAQLHADSWRRTYRGNFRDEFLDGDVLADRQEAWRERLDRPPPNQLVSLATDRARVVCFVCAYGGQDPRWGSFIDNLHVAHDHRRAGVGSGLMRHAGAWLAASHGDRGVYLWVWEANQAARRFYEGLGAANAGTADVANPGGGTGRSCRYTWPSPEALTRDAPRDTR